MILEMLTVGPFQENCYIIGDEQTSTGALVDPGDEAEKLVGVKEHPFTRPHRARSRADGAR